MRYSAGGAADTGLDRLLRGDIPPGGHCDVKTLAAEAGVDRTTFYGNRPYAHLRIEFEQRLQTLQQAGERPDPRDAQIGRLKTDIDKLRNRLSQADQKIAELTDFRAQALSRLAAQNEEIVRLRNASDGANRIIRLPVNRPKLIGPC